MLDEPASRYPNAPDGRIAVPAQADWLDPLVGLSFAAEATRTLGVGVGWSREEFAALGVPFARRGARAAEYVAAMRTLWRDPVASFEGEFARFEAIRVNPKPVRGRIPIVLGGNSDAALARAGVWGDGWYGFNVESVEAVHERVGVLHARTREVGRDPAALEVAVALTQVAPDDLPALAGADVTQLVLVESPPADPGEARDWIRALADRWPSPARAPAR